MSYYENREIRIRAFGLPMEPAERESVKTMLLGFSAKPISDELVDALERTGIYVDTLSPHRGGRGQLAGHQYISYVRPA